MTRYLLFAAGRILEAFWGYEVCKPDVHTPHIGNLGDDPAAVQKIVDAKIPMTSTLAVFVPHFDANGTALFRDRQPFPWHALSTAGQGSVNARLLWECLLNDRQ